MGQEKFIVYQYLKFIWNKKWLLILVTLLLAASGFLYAHKHAATYSGQAMVFTGNGQNDMLSKPEFIKAKYEKLAHNSNFVVAVPGNFEVTLTVTGTNKATTQKQIKKVSNQYIKDLAQRFNDQYSARKDYVKALKQKISKMETENDRYNQLIAQSNNEQKLSSYTDILLQQQDAVAGYKDKLYKTQYQLALMEKPKLMSVGTASKSGSTLKDMTLGGAFGFQMMLIILIVWKYILDARRSLNA